MRQYRAGNPGYVQHERLRGTARYRALSVLARQHPDEFDRLLRAEMRRPRDE
jgi:hypothetical protein